MNNLIKNLYIIATPIGNLDDISSRSILTLQSVDYIICENIKHSLKLLNKKGIKKKLLPLHDYNEKKIIDRIVKTSDAQNIALISDAGSPLISDPGYNLVKFFIENNFNITAIPGPSSVIAALQISGIPINNFAFYGFVPKPLSKQKQFFLRIKEVGLTSIFFVSAKNLNQSIIFIHEHLADRDVAICKEITKLNEKVHRGLAKNILMQIKEKKIVLKGEFTVVVSGKNNKKKDKINDNLIKTLMALMKKFNLTEAVKIVHSLTGISKKEVYKMAIKLKND